MKPADWWMVLLGAIITGFLGFTAWDNVQFQKEYDRQRQEESRWIYQTTN